MDLDRALRQFDRTDANVRRLEKLSERMAAMVPEGIDFASGSPEGRDHNELRRQFADLLSALPAVDGYRIDAEPLSLDDIAQWRLEAFQASLPADSLVDLRQQIAAPREAVAEYRHRFTRMRRRLTQRQVRRLVADVDELLATIRSRNSQERGSVGEDPLWPQLRDSVAQIRRCLGDQTSGRVWNDLARHLSFAEAVDLRDIFERDWPSVRADIEARGYSDDEPLSVEVEDLASLVAERPAGPVTTALAWDRLDDEGFERLVFNLLGDAAGYQNPRWLTKTNAPDRGRDLSVERELTDALGGSRHQRVTVQCKHWTRQSVRPTHTAEAVTQAEGWQPPFDALVVATSGRFTIDAVNWVEQHNRTHRLQIEMWPESHLEVLLAIRPWLVEQSNLRSAAS